MPKSGDPNVPYISLQMEKLVDEYFLNGGNKKAAMIAAGYNVEYDSYGYLLFERPGVKKLIEDRKRALREKFEVKFETIIDALAEIATGFKRLAKYKKVDEDGNPYWDFTGATEEDLAFITSIESKTKFDGEDGAVTREVKIGAADIKDAKAALDSLAKLVGLDKNRIEISGPDGQPIEVSNKELARRMLYIIDKGSKEESN